MTFVAEVAANSVVSMETMSMPMQSSSDPAPVTHLLQRCRAGDAAAVAELGAVLHDELRARAARLMRRERGDHTLDATALVHEAWLRLAAHPEAVHEDRQEFLRLAGRVMRNVLVDHARRRGAERRRGPLAAGERVTLDLAADTAAGDPAAVLDLLDLEDALQALGARDPQLVELVELRFFSGLTLAEIGEVVGLSVSHVHRRWALARAFLLRELRKGASATSAPEAPAG